MGMTREGLCLGWKECPCSPLQWEEAPELPETWLPLHLASFCRALWGLFPYSFHVSFECPRCCFRLLTLEQTMGVSVLSSIRAVRMQYLPLHCCLLPFIPLPL